MLLFMKNLRKLRLKIFNFVWLIFFVVLFSNGSRANVPIVFAVGGAVVSIEGEERFYSFGRGEYVYKNYEYTLPSIGIEVGSNFDDKFPFLAYFGQDIGFFTIDGINFLNFTSKVGLVPKINNIIEANPFVEIGFSNLRKSSNDGFRYVPGLFFSTGVHFGFDFFYMKINYNKQIYKYIHNDTLLHGREAVFNGSGLGLAFFKKFNFFDE